MFLCVCTTVDDLTVELHFFLLMVCLIATRFKRQFLVNVDIPATSDNAMLLAFAERKLTDMLRDTVFSKAPAATSS